MPLRSSAIVRIDVLTTVWSSAERNIPAMRPTTTRVIWRFVMMGFAEMGMEAFMLKIALFEGREYRMGHGH